MTKKDLQVAYDQLKESFEALEQDFEAVKEDLTDRQAQIEAHRAEAKRIKESLKNSKEQAKEYKAKAATQNNRANQIAHRKKELEHELGVYRKTIDNYGDKFTKLASMAIIHFDEIEDLVPPKRWFHLSKINQSFEKIKEITTNAKSEIESSL